MPGKDLDPIKKALKEQGSQVFVRASGGGYIKAISGLVDDMCRKEGRRGILISTQWSANAISRRLAITKLPKNSLRVVDTVSLTMGSGMENNDVFRFLPTPASLESILMEVERIMGSKRGEISFLIVDSLSYLIKYYSQGQLSEFFQYLLNRMLEDGINVIIFDQMTSAPSPISQELSSIMDRMIDLDKGGKK